MTSEPCHSSSSRTSCNTCFRVTSVLLQLQRINNLTAGYSLEVIPGGPRSPRSPLGPRLPSQCEQRQKTGICSIGTETGAFSSQSQIVGSGMGGTSALEASNMVLSIPWCPSGGVARGPGWWVAGTSPSPDTVQWVFGSGLVPSSWPESIRLA